MADRDYLALPGDEGDSPSRQGARPADWALFALRAALRRKLLAVAVLVAGLLAVTGYYALKPPWYRVEARILAQRAQALPSVARSSGYEDTPTRSAWEMIHQRENLISLVRQTNLLERMNAARPEESMAERLVALVRRGPARPRQGGYTLDGVVKTLDKMLVVVTEEGTVEIQLDWRDPVQAYDIVQAAVQNFLEARHLQEVTAIEEVITALQGRAVKARAELEDAVEDARRRPQRPARPALPRAKLPSQELVRLQSTLEAKRRAIQDVEEIRRRRLADLQAQLEQARNVLSDAHPTIIKLRSDIEVASRESHQIETLRDEERKLARQQSELAAREGVSVTAGAQLPPEPLPESSPREEDGRVRETRLRFEQMSTRISQAQLELDAARSAFKYRYNVIWPPQLPDEPVSPKAKKIFTAGVLASIALALVAAMLPDLWRGRIVERWQVERSLNLPVFGEIRRRR